MAATARRFARLERFWRPPVLAAWVAFVIFNACTWDPEVRPIEPRRIAKGSFFVLRHEPIDGVDYLAVVEGLPDGLQKLSLPELRESLAEAPRSMLEVESGRICRLPGTPLNVLRRVDDPTREVLPKHWRMVVTRMRDGEPSLELVDQHCKQRGPTLATAAVPTTYSDEDTDAPLLLVLTEQGELWSMDPWKDDKRRIARNVQDWSFVAAPPNDQLSRDERGLLLLQQGELVVRRLEDGKEVARFGEGVERYTQTSLGGLRVAYESKGVIYEVAGGDLKPVRLAGGDDSACSPNYSGSTLSFYSPCEQRRYVRLDLKTGELETFGRDVYFQYVDRGWELEFRQPKAEQPDAPAPPSEQWVKPPGATEAVQLDTRLSQLRPLDSVRLSGIDGQGRFGLWTEQTGFEPLLQGVETIQTFIDTRATPDRDEPVFLWIVHHDVGDDDVGQLSLLSAEDFSLEPVVGGVPVGGFTTFQFAVLLDPALVLLRDASRSGATLEARLIPDLIGAKIDEGVISFAPKADPLEPGLYYSIGPGEREGIWFAPL